MELEYIAQQHPCLELVEHVLNLQGDWPHIQGIDPPDNKYLLKVGKLLIVDRVSGSLLVGDDRVYFALLLHVNYFKNYLLF